MLKQLKNNNNMAIRLTHQKVEKVLYSEDILRDDFTTKINFVLSDTKRIIFIHADWIDEKYRSSTEVNVARTLCEKINKDAGCELVEWRSNLIKTKNPLVYFRIFELDKYTRIEIYERELKVGIA